MKHLHTATQRKLDQLLEHAKTGDERAFAELVRHYEPFIMSSSFKLCRDREKADETARDTLVNIYRKLHQFEGDSKFSTWLYTIMVNNCLMKRRKRKLDKARISLEDLPEGSRGETEMAGSSKPDRNILNEELKRAIDTAIEKLPAEYQIVFLMREIEQRPASEVAEALNLTIPAVKSRLHRARKFLQEELKEYVE